MIILDYQQVAIANLMAQLAFNKNMPVDENLLRGMILNSIRFNRVKFKDYGELVVATDARQSWRKDVFPYYKARRHENRQHSEIDWDMVFRVFTEVREELKAYFPYRVIHTEGAEADDIIGVLAMEFGTPEDELYFGNNHGQIMICSGDKDFPQLQRHSNVNQFSPVQKKRIATNDPVRFLKEHIIRGDVGDGVPNFLSDDDCLVTRTKQKSIMEVKLNEWLKQSPEEFCITDAMKRNWKRNEQLIDLRFTPKNIKEQVLEQYHAQSGKDRRRLDSYFIKHRLRLLHEHINEF